MEDLEAVNAACPDCPLEGTLRWLAYTVETEGLLGEIIDSTQRISTLVNAAKQYSQMDRAPHQWLDLHEGLFATMTMLKPKLGGITIHKELDKSLPRIPGYPAELNQVWTNLIDNARDAMDGSGTLTIRTRREDDCAVVEIEDTGPGIAPEVRKRIFEPFFTTKPVGHGTGLGLDVSFRVVVNRHHGDLRVESEPGRTVFTVVLPMTESGASAPPEPDAELIVGHAAAVPRCATSAAVAVRRRLGVRADVELLVHARPHHPGGTLHGRVVRDALVGAHELLVPLVPGLRSEHVADGRSQQELQHEPSRHVVSSPRRHPAAGHARVPGGWGRGDGAPRAVR